MRYDLTITNLEDDMSTYPLANAHRINVPLSELTEAQAAEHIELTVWEALFNVDPNTDVWHYSCPDNDTCIIVNRCPMTLVISHGDAVVEVPVTVTVGDQEWLLSRNHIDALIDLHMQVLQQSMRGEA